MRADGKFGAGFANEFIKIFYGVRSKAIVGVEKSNVITLGFFEAKVASGGKPAVFGVENASARVERSVSFEERGGTIG